jgi:hypothetical protein
LRAQTGIVPKEAGEKKSDSKKTPTDKPQSDKPQSDKPLPDIKFDRWATSECLIDATYKDKDEQGGPIAPYLELKVTFAFETIKENTLVYLGMRGAYLTSPGTFLGDVPHLLPDDEGNYFLLVPKANKYPRLALDFELPVKTKEGTGIGAERSFELGLPGAPSTRFVLRLAPSVKKLRWNDRDDEQVGGSGVWDLKWFGLEKSLRVQWKESTPSPLGLAMSKTETQVEVRLDRSHTETTGTFTVELQRGQTKEWQFWLPPQAKVSTPPDWEWILPEGKPVPFVLKSKKGATSERVSFAFQVTASRTAGQQKVLVGPFLVVGAAQSEGVITVKATPDLLQGHRLFYNRLGELYPRDPIKGVGSDVVAHFQFQANPFANKPMPPSKALLEIDIKPERAVHEVTTFHDVKLRTELGQMIVEADSRFVAKSPSALEIDVVVPLIAPWETQALAVSMQGGALAAAPLPLLVCPIETLYPSQVSSPEDGGPLPSLDASRRVKIRTIKNAAGDWEARLQTRYLVPPGRQRLHLEVPRPSSGASDRGGRATLSVPSSFELLARHRGGEEAIGVKHTLSYEQAPVLLDMAWRDFVPEIHAAARAFVTIQGGEIHVHQSLTVPKPKGPVSALDNRTLALVVPPEARLLKVLGKDGKEREDAPPASPRIWRVTPNIDASERAHIELEYYVTPQLGAENMAFTLPLLWPDRVTARQATIAFFTEPGVYPRVARSAALARLWHVVGASPRDLVLGDRVPALVLSAAGHDLPLALELDKPEGFRPPSLVCDRSELEVRVDEEGTQTYAVLLSVQKIASAELEVEFPVSGTEVEMHRTTSDDRGRRVKLIWESVPGRPNGARLKLRGNESRLEFHYTIPASQTSGKRFWHTSFFPPRFQADVFPGRVHWNIALQDSQVPIVLGNVQVDYRWGLPRWLLGPESPDHAYSIMLIRDRLEPQRLYHPSWQPWILLCSGAVLLLGILFLMLREARFWSWLLAAFTVMGLGAVAWFSPYFLLPFFWGAQAGLAVLALVAAVHWFLQERYRRQLIFLPGFSRGQPGSTLSRGKKPREPSTIDAPLSHGAGSGS